MIMWRLGRLTPVIMAVFVATAPAAAVTYSYTVIDGPAAPDLAGTVVNAINNNGLATGYYVNAPMGPPGVYTSFITQADGQGFTSFSRPGYEQTGAAGINDAGDIVGVSVLHYGMGNGFVRSASGTYTDIVPTFGGTASAYSEALGINDGGDIVGFYTDTMPPSLDAIQAYSHGFLFSGGSYTAIDVPAIYGYGTQLFSINNAGIVSGDFLDNVYNAPHGFLYALGTGQFTLAPGPVTSIGAVNDLGAYTYSDLVPDPQNPLGYDAISYVSAGTMQSLVAVPNATSTQTQGLNNLGQVTGVFTDAGGAIHGFIATPVPEVATWMTMVMGFGAIGGAMRGHARRTRRAPRSLASRLPLPAE